MTTTVEVSATGLPQYRRLAQFLADVGRYADEQVDLELRELVKEACGDLLRMR